MNNSVLKGVNVAPHKRNMEEGHFSLMRSIYRKTSQPKEYNYNGSILFYLDHDDSKLFNTVFCYELHYDKFFYKHYI